MKSGVSGILVVGLWLVTLPMVEHILGQRPEPTVHGTFDGDTVYAVLPPGAIPAIVEPVFLAGEDAEDQMSADEPVLGIMLGGDVKAYSLWHLDAHEIVNDTIAGIPIAATW